MSTHNVRFHGEERKNKLFFVEKKVPCLSKIKSALFKAL